jgi:hypothetical protein
VLDTDVVAGGVSVRTRDAHAASSGARHETKLGPFAALLASCDGTPVAFGRNRSTHVSPQIFAIDLESVGGGIRRFGQRKRRGRSRALKYLLM